VLTADDFDGVDDDADEWVDNVIGVNLTKGCPETICEDQSPLALWTTMPQNWTL
jgi:hypothetical protein